jgi:hypothetical protein
MEMYEEFKLTSVERNPQLNQASPHIHRNTVSWCFKPQFGSGLLHRNTIFKQRIRTGSKLKCLVETMVSPFLEERIFIESHYSYKSFYKCNVQQPVMKLEFLCTIKSNNNKETDVNNWNSRTIKQLNCD